MLKRLRSRPMRLGSVLNTRRLNAIHLSNLDIKDSGLSAPLDFVDTHRVHRDMYRSALDISLQEACFNFNSTSTHYTRTT